MWQYFISLLVLLNAINRFYFKLLCGLPPSPFDDFKGAFDFILLRSYKSWFVVTISGSPLELVFFLGGGGWVRIHNKYTMSNVGLCSEFSKKPCSCDCFATPFYHPSPIEAYSQIPKKPFITGI